MIYRHPAALADEPGATGETALDGDARGYARTPDEPSSVAATVLRGIGTGAGHLLRGLLLPARGVIYAETRWQVSNRIEDLVWNDARTFALYPTASFSAGTGPLVGVRTLYRDFLGHGELLSASFQTGSVVPHATEARLTVPALAGSRFYLGATVRHEKDEAVSFAGIGNGDDLMSGAALDARAGTIDTIFTETRLLAAAEAGVALGGPGGAVRLGGYLSYNDRSFDEAPETGSTPSIGTVYDTATVDGFDDGVQALEVGVRVSLDTRDTPGPTGSGATVNAFVAAGGIVDDQQYGRYGIAVAGYWTPLWPGRVLSARISHEGVRELDGDVPFTELPRLGGATVLRGYPGGQFRDRLATVASLAYHYPIHANVSGEVFVDAGKVARTYDELAGDGATDDWHLGTGGGLLIHTPSSLKLRLDVAYGDGVHVFVGADLLGAFTDQETEL